MSDLVNLAERDDTLVRWIYVVCVLFLAFPIASQAQGARFSVAVAGCADLGETIALRGEALGDNQQGTVALRDGNQAIPMTVRRWTDRLIRAQVPRQRVEAGSTYEVVWVVDQRVAVRFGDVEICGLVSAQGTSKATSASSDEVGSPEGTPEYLVSAPTDKADAAVDALRRQGARLLRTRRLPSLERVILIYSLPESLSLVQVQSILDGSANGSHVDVHSVYRYAAGPRLYAAEAIGDNKNSVCRLRLPVRVGMIDGPVDPRHPGLRGARIERANVFESGFRTPGPDHGTAVASLIGGTGAGSVAGFAAGAHLFAASAFTFDRGQPGARLEHIAASLDWLAANGVRIVNMSIAGPANEAFQDILSAAARQGLVMIAATGNADSSVAAFPAGAAEVIAVTAVDARERPYDQATRGSHVEFAAPGVQVWAARGRAGGYLTGTSFAAPIVTALVARQAAAGGVNVSSVRTNLRRTAKDLGPSGRDSIFGWGLVQSGGC